MRAATVATLRALKGRFYVPNNAALFVGGDVTPDAVVTAAKKYLRNWPRGADPWANPAPPHPGLYKKEYIWAYYLTHNDYQVLKAPSPALTCLDAG